MESFSIYGGTIGKTKNYREIKFVPQKGEKRFVGLVKSTTSFFIHLFSFSSLILPSPIRLAANGTRGSHWKLHNNKIKAGNPRVVRDCFSD